MDSCGAGLTCMKWVAAGYFSQQCDDAAKACPSGSTCSDIGRRSPGLCNGCS